MHQAYDAASPHESKQAGERTRVACLGDSLTRGDALHEPPYGTHPPWSFQSIMHSRGNYPATLQTLLGSRWHVANFGHSGWSSLDLAKAYSNYSRKQGGRGFNGWHQLACYGPQLVLLMVGTNDVLHAPGYGSAIGLNESQVATGFRHGLTSTLSSLLALPSQPHVVLLDPPPIGPAAAAHKEHTCLNKLIPSLLAGAARGLPRVHHLSGRAIWGECPDRQRACCLMHIDDQVHLNAIGSEALARQIFGWITRPQFMGQRLTHVPAQDAHDVTLLRTHATHRGTGGRV